MGELILIVFFALGFFLMSYKYYYLSKSFRDLKTNRNHWRKEYRKIMDR